MRVSRLACALALLAAFALGQVTTRPTSWRLPRLFEGTLLEASYIPSAIKSIQAVSITFSGSTGTYTTSPTVTASNALLILQGFVSGDGSSGLFGTPTLSYAQITNGTTITGTQSSSNTNTTWSGVLVEFIVQFVKSQACNTIAFTGGSGTFTIGGSGVNTAKTALAWTGWTASANYTFDTAHQSTNQATPKVVLTNATTVTATVAASGLGDTRTIGFCYLEFK